MAVKISRAMSEQSDAVVQITRAVDETRKQSEQTARAIAEQSRAMKDVTAGTQNVSKQIALITRANRDHSNVAGSLHEFLDTGTRESGRARPQAKAAAASGNGKGAPGRRRTTRKR